MTRTFITITALALAIGVTVPVQTGAHESSDEKFATGVYKTGKVQWEISEPWGVDEFIYLLEGSMTLTSSDGTVQVWSNK